MPKLVITKTSKLWSDGCHREDGHFDPIAITLEEAIEVCKAEPNTFTEITLLKNDQKHTIIARFEYCGDELKKSSQSLTDELKKTKVKLFCCVGGWGMMDFHVTQVSDESEELINFVSIEEIEAHTERILKGR